MPKGKKAEPTPASSDSEAELTLADIAETLKTLTRTITSVKQTLDQQVDKQVVESKTNENNHEELKRELKDIKEELTAVTKRADESDTVNKVQAIRIEQLENKISDLEDEKRSHNIIIEGIREKNNEDIRGIVDDLLKDLGLNYNVEWCDSIYRLGPKIDGNKRPRPIKVVFPYLRYKHLLFKQLYKLGTLQGWEGVYINDDMSPQKQAQRKEMRAIFSFAKSTGIDCQLRGTRLIVDKKPYTYEKLSDLPHGLSIEAAKMVKVHDGLAFQSKHAPLSNLYPCQIQHQDKKYTSVEQGLQYEHATTCNDEGIATQITKTDDPERIMSLARRLPESEEWKTKEVEVCKKYNTMKYEQNPTLKRRLLQTKGHLYEATRNKTFGCGFTLVDSKKIRKENVQTGNKLGEILENLRDVHFVNDK